MNTVVFDNPTMHVIDYAGQDAIEIIDKRSGRQGLVRGALAQRFRQDFLVLIRQQAEAEDFEDFMDDYEAVINQAPLIH